MARANAFTSQKTQQQQQQEPWPRCTIIFGLRQLNEAIFHTVDRSHWAEIMYANIFGNVGQPSSVSPFTLPVVKKTTIASAQFRIFLAHCQRAI